MNRLLFSLHNVLLSTEHGNADLDDTDYSCLWTVQDDVYGERAVIDLRSFARQEWHDRKSHWVPCQMPDLVVLALESILQKKLDIDALIDERNVLEEAS